MALKAKKSLKEKAVTNAQVTKGTSKNQEVLKAGTPNDHTRKHLSESPLVGVSIGTTLNMGDYQSLRVDVWLTDNVSDKEDTKQAYDRVVSTVNQVLQEIVSQYQDE